MTNNSILRRIRYMFDYSDPKMIEIFALGGLDVSREQLKGWLKKDEDPQQTSCHDAHLSAFLNGLIIEQRGQREGARPVADKRLGNNLILKKLKIAFNLKADDIQALLADVDFNISKPELSAFFRKQGHKNYRECKDQVLRNLLKALQMKLRPGDEKKQEKPAFKW